MESDNFDYKNSKFNQPYDNINLPSMPKVSGFKMALFSQRNVIWHVFPGWELWPDITLWLLIILHLNLIYWCSFRIGLDEIPPLNEATDPSSSMTSNIGMLDDEQTEPNSK